LVTCYSFLFPDCGCKNEGTVEEICDKSTGKCLCKEGFGGSAICDVCEDGFFDYPTCAPCECSEVGSSDEICEEDGQCPCRNNYGERQCNECSIGYYEYPECKGKY
jgi:laminin alpha 3/5